MVSWSIWTLWPARAVSASTVIVLSASAGLSWPRRSAVEPDTATPIVWRPACCSALAAASITTPFPVPAGPISTAIALRPGDRLQGVALLARERCGDPLRDDALGERAVAVADDHPVGVAREGGDVAFDRELPLTLRPGREASAFERDYALVADHPLDADERLLRRELADRLLQCDGA